MEDISRRKRSLPALHPQPENIKRNKCGIPRNVDDDDAAEVERKVMTLQRIVPGGEALENMDMLFDETAGYILTLQARIKAMRLLTSLLEGIQKEEKKLGG